MRRQTTRRSTMVGLPPGTLVHIGERRVERVTLSVIDYDKDGVREHAVSTPEECCQYLAQNTVTWINVTGLHDVDMLRRVGDVFHIHQLVLEDIVNTGQRPKMEDMGEYLFIVLKMLYRRADEGNSIVAEQVSLILGRNYVVSFQEIEGDVFDMIRERIRTAKGRIRQMGCDYLAYSLIDAIVDNYFLVLEDMGDRAEAIQEAVLETADADLLESIHRMKRDLVFMRRNLWPVRELASALERTESDLFQHSLAPYVRDLYEHALQVLDHMESLRDMASGALDMYMMTASNRMNEVMKVLTVIATIFIPITFIAGVYGMNFKRMPELEWRFGYLGAWGAMLLTVAAMLVFFRRKKWL